MNMGTDAAGYIPVEADFKFKHTDGELALDDNFAAQSFWKDVLIRYFKKISAVIGLILIIIITVFAIIGPVSYTHLDVYKRQVSKVRSGRLC